MPISIIISDYDDVIPDFNCNGMVTIPLPLPLPLPVPVPVLII